MEPAVLWTDLRTHIVYGGDEKEDGRDDVEEDDEGEDDQHDCRGRSLRNPSACKEKGQSFSVVQTCVCVCRPRKGVGKKRNVECLCLSSPGWRNTLHNREKSQFLLWETTDIVLGLNDMEFEMSTVALMQAA